MSDQEAGLIMRTLAENVQSYDQVVEVSVLPKALLRPPLIYRGFSFWHIYHPPEEGFCTLVLGCSINRKPSARKRWTFLTS